MSEPKRIELANLPTPLVRMERLSAQLGGADIWVKRDDLSGVEVSGNKIRKLEYVLADAQARGCDTLVTEGTAQSNHCRATAAVCARLGMKAVLLFRPEPRAGAPRGNHFLDVMFGAETRFFDRDEFDARRSEILDEIRSELSAAGRKPRWTPAGASEPLGCWGYIRAIKELAEQLRAAKIDACDVVVAVSSGGTFAGLLLGQALYGIDEVNLIGVPVSDDEAYHNQAIAALCGKTIAEFGLKVAMDDLRMRFLDGFVGEGYGIPYDDAIDGLRMLARTEGIMLDPVYTCKAFYGLLSEVKAGRLGQDRPVVFLHTGGIYSNFANSELLIQSAVKV